MVMGYFSYVHLEGIIKDKFECCHIDSQLFLSAQKASFHALAISISAKECAAVLTGFPVGYFVVNLALFL